MDANERQSKVTYLCFEATRLIVEALNLIEIQFFIKIRVYSRPFAVKISEKG